MSWNAVVHLSWKFIRPSHQEVVAQCYPNWQQRRLSGPFSWIDRRSDQLPSSSFLTGPPTCSTPNYLWKIFFSTTNINPPFFVTSRTRQVQQSNSKHQQVSGEASTLLLRKTSKVRLGSFTPTENLRDLISLHAKCRAGRKGWRPSPMQENVGEKTHHSLVKRQRGFCAHSVKCAGGVRAHSPSLCNSYLDEITLHA